MTIEIIKESDYAETAAMIGRSVRSRAFASFYPDCSLDYVAGDFDENGVKKYAQRMHFYVVRQGGRIIGSGAVGPLGESGEESCLHAIFIDPEFQGQGVGRRLIEAIEKDEYFTRARRVEVSSSLPAIPFYKKLGYRHKDNDLIYDDGQILLEKFPGGETR